ncbi:mitochondrial RNA polymerase isoform X2 [Rhynchophorus ferrugineus]|uniref:mitochondrial RNA polymerase isoform X2 n=1 Tax=Rhynchophorus ferrugineus TaxID=354439 RepID=UPI003FCE7B24
MYQLYKYGSYSFQKNLPLSLRSLSVNQDLTSFERTCLLCKHLNVNLCVQTRDQSSATNANLKKIRKQLRRRAIKKVTDVFVVTDKFSGLQKANVVKFTPKEINLLAASNLSLDELYKIRKLTHKSVNNLSHTYSDLVVENILNNTAPITNNIYLENDKVNNVVEAETEKENLHQSEDIQPAIHQSILNIEQELLLAEAEEESQLHEENDLLGYKNDGVSPALQPEVPEIITEYQEVKEIPQVESRIYNTIEKNYKHEIAAKTLAAYMEVCNVLKNPKRGLNALYYHQSRVRRKLHSTSIQFANVYSTLLKGFAHKGDFCSLKQVLDIMKEENVEPDLHCYVAIFECLGRINIQNHYLKDIRIYVKEAMRNNITFDDMLNNGIYLGDQREMVLKAFKAVNNNYVPVPKVPQIQYKNHLLDSLNNEKQLKLDIPTTCDNNGLFTSSEMNERIVKQVKLEDDGYVTIKSIDVKSDISKEVKHCRHVLTVHYNMWRKDAEEAFHRDLATLTAKRRPISLEPYIRCLPVKEFIDIILEEAKRLSYGSETYSPEVSLLYRILGQRVYARYINRLKQKGGVLEKILQIHTKYCETYAAMHRKLDALPDQEQYVNSRTQWQLIEHSLSSKGATLELGHNPWTPSTLTAIGKFMYHIIMHDLKIDVNSLRIESKHKNYLPAFYTIFRNQGRLVKEEVKPHPVLSKLYKASLPETLTFLTSEVPMVCPPVPWTSMTNGGYIIAPTDVVRLPYQATLQKKIMSEVDPVQLYPSLDALNQLASVPWKVNTRVLDIILKVFRSGGSAKLDVPEPPSALLPLPPITPNMDKAEKQHIFRQKLQQKRKKAEMYSLWSDCLYRLSLAEHFRNDIFWLPHNMDFRGRVYPVPPHLNHLGSDLARSILIFAEGRPLGPDGLDWLKIHLVNLTGLKKRDSIKDRLEFANENMDLILDSADHPLDGKMWWAGSDEPWQTLACCIEVANVVRSGIDPADYVSHFPIHQDGSCNGLQHYAALGRDSAGAHSVNLVASDVPQDVYSAVVALVEEQRAKDAKNGLQIAAVLKGFVKRKVIKQTIMTTVYGVTKFGARLQIAKQLKDIDDFPKDAIWSASSYLTGYQIW